MADKNNLTSNDENAPPPDNVLPAHIDDVGSELEPALKKPRDSNLDKRMTRSSQMYSPPKHMDDEHTPQALLMQLRQKDEEIKLAKQSSKKQLKSCEERIASLILAKDEANARLAEVENNAKIQVRSLNEQIQLLSDDNDGKEKQCQQLQERLKQKELEYRDLLEQVDVLDINLSGAEAPTPEKEKPKGLIFLDDITNDISNYLPSIACWSANRRSLSTVDKEVLQAYNFAVFLTGTQELVGEQTWNQLSKDAKLAAQTAIDSGCHPIFVHLPPVNKVNVTGKVSLFNRMLERIESATVITPDTRNYSKNCFVKPDGITLTQVGCKLYVKQFEEDLSKILSDLPKHETESAQPSTSNSLSQSSLLADDKFSSFIGIEKNLHGKIIGRGGHVIKALTSDNRVEMSMGHWCEKEKGGELKIVSSGALVTGSLKNVMAVKMQVSEILSSK